MVRPCFLVIDREFSGNISTRKLVIETAKFNVITAYSGAEAIATAARFPNIDGVVLDAGMEDMPGAKVASEIKKKHPGVPIISVGGLGDSPAIDHHVNYFDPAKLLDLLKSLHPKDAAAIEANDEILSRHEGKGQP